MACCEPELAMAEVALWAWAPGSPEVAVTEVIFRPCE
jgi:hypothetical protein